MLMPRFKAPGMPAPMGGFPRVRYADGGKVRSPAEDGIVGDAIKKRKARLDAAADGEEYTPPARESARDAKKEQPKDNAPGLFDRIKTAVGFADGGVVRNRDFKK